MRGVLKNPTSRRACTLLAGVIAVCCRSGWSGVGAHAFAGIYGVYHAPSLTRAVTQRRSTLVQNLHRDNNNDSNKNFDLDLFVRRVKRADRTLLRRFERADKNEILTDATLAVSYVFGRFLAYDIVISSARIEPGWEVQDFVWLTGTLSSATVLVVYYVVAGLLSRTFEVNSSFTLHPAVKAVVNVALCCPAWLVTEHLLAYGPVDIAGDTFGGAVISGVVGLGSFMALLKTLSAGMR